MTSVWEAVTCEHGDYGPQDCSSSYFSTEAKANIYADYWNERFNQKCRDRGLPPRGWVEVREIVLDEDEVT